MNITKLEDWTLLVPSRAKWTAEDWETIVWDWIIEISQDSPEYKKYLEMYNHDLFIALEQKKLLEEDDEDNEENNVESKNENTNLNI